jgi:hypothetical protein
MRLAAGSAPVAVEPVNKVKTSLNFSTAQSREPANKLKKFSVYFHAVDTLFYVLKIRLNEKLDVFQRCSIIHYFTVASITPILETHVPDMFYY